MARANLRNVLRAAELRLWLLGVAIATLVACLTLSLPKAAFGQGATGAINGTITDSSMAVIPGAAVVLHNVATGIERSAVTNQAGQYVLPEVIPGPYTLRVSKEGFNTVTENEFTLDVNQTSTHDIMLPVGRTRQEVNVTATTAQLEATSAELGTAIGTSEVSDLPLNGRNFTQLLDLTPGVSPISTGQNASGGGGLREMRLELLPSLR